MAANVRENVRLAVGVPGQDQRGSIMVVSDRLAVPGQQGGRRKQMRHMVKDRPLLGFEPGRVDIGAGGDGLDSGTQRGFAPRKGFGEGVLAGRRAARRSGHIHLTEGCATSTSLARAN